MFGISTKGRYATRIMVYLAANADRFPIRSQEIAQNEEITEDYVEQLMGRLRSLGMVKSQRGPTGGFILSCDPTKTTVADILAATEGSFDFAPCRRENCTRAKDCVTREVWENASKAMQNVFAGKTIADLVQQARDRQATHELCYEI